MTDTMPTEADQRRVIDALRRELEARTAELAEARAEQAATADVLRVISRSGFDLQTVLETLTRSAVELSGAHRGVIFLRDGNIFLYRASSHGDFNPEWIKWMEEHPMREGRQSATARAIARGQTVCIPDVLADPEIDLPATPLADIRAALAVPLLRDGRVEGVMTLSRQVPGPFTDRQIELVSTFADQALIAIENARLFDEVQAKTHDLEEALRYQTGSANILNVIASSPTDVQPVLNAIAESACELCEAHDAVVLLKDGNDLCFSAHHGPIPINTERWPIDRSWASGRAVVDRATVHVHDIYADDAGDFHGGRELSRRAGSTAVRSILAAPLLREGESIGAVLLRRQEVRPFNNKQIALLQTFADQAVIAIENARLFDEVQARTRDLQESLQQQTATADVLKVISRSAFDLDSVMNALTNSAAELCSADTSALHLREGDVLVARGMFAANDTQKDFLRRNSIPVDNQSYSGRAVLTGSVTNIGDVEKDQSSAVLQRFRGAIGYRALLLVPLVRDGRTVGLFSLSRNRAGAFSEREVELVQTFADQAVIAIENVRLFEEVQAKTHDLEEALRYQTGSGNILNVIASSPTDVKPVLTAIVESACELVGAYDAAALLRDGEDLRFSAHYGPIPIGLEKWPINRRWTAGRAFLDRKPVHIEDLRDEKHADFSDGRELSLRMGHRSTLSVPLLREGESIGAIVLRRTEVNPFNDKQIALLQTFADQAVIALGNVRLFEEVQARTRDLQESLQQQTATAEVLKVISSSPGELKPVFSSMLENAVSICDAKFGNLFLVDGDTARWEAGVGTPPKLAEFFTQSTWFRPTPGSHLARVLRTKQVSHTDDDTAETVIGVSARLGGARSTVCVPMVKDDTLVGAIFIYRTEVRPFTDKQIDLVKNFAAQAVIAIENARLLKELRRRTDDLSASLDDLRAAQDRLVQTEKLASLGQLTAGIAHEIKNPLNFVNNFAALSVELTDELNDALKQAAIADKLRAEVDELTGFLKDNLAKIVQHGKRADSIVKNMLLHSREGSGEHRPADINALMDESLNLAYHGARAEKPQFNVTLQRHFDPEAGMVDVFPQEITRVFLNLLSNGFYAVSKRKADNGAGFEPTVSAMTKGRTDGVEIRIRDNGTGIPPDVKEKMFNPFFTTKPAGEGTGLGLSMSYDIIVKQHGGTIDVETRPGEFTEFTIVLPRTSLSRKN